MAKAVKRLPKINDKFKCQALALKAIRHNNGLAQKELADIIGISEAQMISNIERGLCPFPEKHFSKIKHLKGADSLFKAAVDDFKKNWKKTAGLII